MLSLPLPQRWAIVDFVRIARTKKGRRKKRLLKLVSVVDHAFCSYASAAPELHTAQSLPLAKYARVDLLDTYNGPTKVLRDIKTHIRRITRTVTSRCQYCGINPEANTFDHYLEKAAFPQYAVLDRNLVPSCASCNQLRKNTLRNGERCVLHFYYDSVASISALLTAAIVRSNDSFFATFHTRPLAEDASALDRLYVRHFESLHLGRRYREASSDVLAEVLFTVIASQPRAERDFSVVAARLMLRRSAAAIRKVHGVNDWRAVLHDSAAASDDFLTACGDRWSAQ